MLQPAETTRSRSTRRGIVNLGGENRWRWQWSVVLESPQPAVTVRQISKDRDRKSR